MSYSLYLIHCPLLFWYVYHPHHFITLPTPLAACIVFGLVGLAAYLCWALIEMPCRNGLVNAWDRLQHSPPSHPRAARPCL